MAGPIAPIQQWGETGPTVKALSDALGTYDWKQARALSDGLISELDRAGAPYPEKPARQVLALLRRKRRFELMEAVADALVRGGQSAPQVLRQYAQALIDQGKFTTARMVLSSILNDPATPASEQAEANGLLGRIQKQLYVNANDPSNPRQQSALREAVRQYYGVYKTDPKSYLWHGINSVALLARAARDGVPVEGFPAPTDIAREIDGTLQQIDDLNMWDRATAVENAVALGDWKAAYDHVLYYVADPQADAFEIGSLLRQLTEVWQLSNGSEPGSTLLPTLKAALLQREGGRVDVPQASIVAEASTAQNAKANLERVSGKQLEKVFGTDRYQPLGWLRTSLKRCEAIARVESVTGTHLGTGFLVKASDFFPDRSEKEVLLLTNAHVISPLDSPYPGALPPEAAVANFEANNKTLAVGDVIWSSPPYELDATFVTLEDLGDASELCPLAPPAASFDHSQKQRVYVIGYPLGGGLSVSLQDSIWLDADDTMLHYRTPTEPGSSGSPVFDDQFWTLIALHHAGESDIPRLGGQPGTEEANEGIAISAIQKATRQATAKPQPNITNPQEK